MPLLEPPSAWPGQSCFEFRKLQKPSVRLQTSSTYRYRYLLSCLYVLIEMLYVRLIDNRFVESNESTLEGINLQIGRSR
jgi:hypothetical protein